LVQLSTDPDLLLNSSERQICDMFGVIHYRVTVFFKCLVRDGCQNNVNPALMLKWFIMNSQ